MDKIKLAKISLDDGASYGEEIPIGVEASNVDLPDGTNLGDYLEDMKIANELKASLKSARLRNYQGEVPVGARSLTIGSNNRAVGEDSFAEGKATYAVGNFCHAEGNGTTAGFKDTSTGKTTYAAHAEGGNTQALGMYSHAEGYNTIAKANMSHCEGFGGEARGTSSHVEGLGTISHASYQHVQGKYNVEDIENKYAHIVGGGTGSSEDQRKNIHTLDWYGNAVYSGDVTITVEGEQIPLSSIVDVFRTGAAAHNSVYRGKFLGDTITPEQASAINDGTFKNLYLGDYWTVNGVNYRIADFDYWINKGFPEVDKTKVHHLAIVPDSCLATGQMNSSLTTNGGYIGSGMKTNILNTVTSNLPDTFKSRILSRRIMAEGTWTITTLDLMNEVMVYGCYVYTHNNNKQTSDSRQLNLFRFNSGLLNINSDYWLRDVSSETKFCLISQYGDASRDDATNTYGVRPIFAIGG
jgi:hypothetical protein